MLKQIRITALVVAVILSWGGLTQANSSQGDLTKALENFAKAGKQRLEIIYQETSDPAYNTAELVLQYPAGCWYTEHRLDKKADRSYYLDGFEGEANVLLRIGKDLYHSEIMGSQGPYHQVKDKGSHGYMFTDSLLKVKDLEYLRKAYNLRRIGEEKFNGTVCQVFSFRSSTQDKLLGKRVNGRILKSYQDRVWLSKGDQPQIQRVVYFEVYKENQSKQYTAEEMKFSCPSSLQIELE